MSISNLQIVEALAEKKLSEVIELISLIEEKFGVSAAAVAHAAAPAEKAAEVEEKTEFDVIIKGLVDVEKRMEAIRAIRVSMDDASFNLKEAKALLDKLPAPFKTAVSKAVAEELRATLTAAGLVVEVV